MTNGRNVHFALLAVLTYKKRKKKMPKAKMLEDKYKVEFVDFIESENNDDEIVCFGKIMPFLQKIQFIRGLSTDMFHRAFIHELVHGMLIALGMGDMNTEDNVERLTTGIISLLNNNYYYECKIRPE